MFKDTKALVTKVVDTATAPIETFDQTVAANPELVLPLAALHASIIVASIAAATAVVCGHQQVRIAREQTKQIRAKAMLDYHHHHGCHHHGAHHTLPQGPKRLLARRQETPGEAE